MSSKALPEALAERPEPTALEQALAERPQTTAPSDGDLDLDFELDIIEHIETVDLDADGYKGLQVDLWLNPPADQVTLWLNGEKDANGEVITPSLSVNAFLAKVIKRWTLKLKKGGTAPITEQVLRRLPGEVTNMLHDEFWVRAGAPLKARREKMFSAPTKATEPDSIFQTSAS